MRKLLLPALAASALLAVSAPVATAKSHKAHSASIASTLSKLSGAIKGLKKNVAKIERLNKETDKGLTDSLHGVDLRVDTLVNNLAGVKAVQDAIVAGVPQITSALTQLGAGLTSLKTLATATEYGFGQLIVLTPSPAAELGSFIETPDIPDTVQQAMTEQQFVAQHTGNLAVSYGVRSGESDGTGASNPAAACKVTVTNAGGTTQTTAANAAFGGLPFQSVPTKSALTSTDPANAGFPFGLKQTGADADQTTTYVSTVPVAAGATYTVGLSCVDTTPSSSDPSA